MQLALIAVSQTLSRAKGDEGDGGQTPTLNCRPLAFRGGLGGSGLEFLEL
jgi:hypothetical protein